MCETYVQTNLLLFSTPIFAVCATSSRGRDSTQRIMNWRLWCLNWQTAIMYTASLRGRDNMYEGNTSLNERAQGERRRGLWAFENLDRGTTRETPEKPVTSKPEEPPEKHTRGTTRGTTRETSYELLALGFAQHQFMSFWLWVLPNTSLWAFGSGFCPKTSLWAFGSVGFAHLIRAFGSSLDIWDSLR